MTAQDAFAFVEKCQASQGLEATKDLAIELIDIVYKERANIIQEYGEITQDLLVPLRGMLQ